MSGQPAQQLLDASVDAAGLSVVTSTRTAAAPRYGAIYNPSTLAAGIPVWFHPLNDGRYVALFTESWSAATLSTTGGPQSYSAKTISTVPHWVTVDPVTGATGPCTVIPTNTPGVRKLVSAVSHGDFLYLIHDDGLLQHHRVTAGGDLVLLDEEVPPARAGVTWKRGIYIDGNYLVLIGTDAMNKVYRARENWARVGADTTTWEYQTDKGWLADGTPVALESGTGVLLSTSSVTYARQGDREYLSLGNSGQANVYSSRMVDPKWRLEQIITGTHVRLQQQLRYNLPALPDGVRNAYPYVRTTLDATSGKNSLQVSWGLLPV